MRKNSNGKKNGIKIMLEKLEDQEIKKQIRNNEGIKEFLENTILFIVGLTSGWMVSRQLNSLGGFVFLLGWATGKTWKNGLSLAAGYYIVITELLPILIRRTTETGMVTAYIEAFVMALLLSIPWSLSSRSILEKSVLMVMSGLILPMIPWLKNFGFCSPFYSAGYMFPGTGYIGFFLEILLVFLIVTISISGKRVVDLKITGLIGLIVCSSVWMNTENRVMKAPRGWSAINTKGVKWSMKNDQKVTFQNLSLAVRKAEKTDVVILPEISLGEFFKQKNEWLNMIGRILARHGKVVIGNGYQMESKKKAVKVVMILGRKNGTEEVQANVPAPLVEWNPFGKITVEMGSGEEFARVKGKKILFSVCWEDVLIGNMLDHEWWVKPDIIISQESDWFTENSTAEKLQEMEIGLMSKLFALPLLRSVNGV